MIDEDRTMQLFGYTSDELSRSTPKKIVVVCGECGKYRVVSKGAINNYVNDDELCHRCANGTVEKRKLSSTQKTGEGNSNFGKTISDEQKTKISISMSGINNPNYKKVYSYEERKAVSAGMQCVTLEEWESFAYEQKYCPKFNEALKEYIRDKHNRECFICGKPESENITASGKQHKLSVHHIDMDKEQGCNDNGWKLIPVCMKHHRVLHNPMWEARIEYLLINKI